MATDETGKKSEETWKAGVLASLDDVSLEAFVKERITTAASKHKAGRESEFAKDFKKARSLYAQSVESARQAKILNDTYTATWEEYAKNYDEFAFFRDPIYRSILKPILSILQRIPGIKQTELYKCFSLIKKSDIQYTLYFAEKEGLIERKKTGRSYELYFIKDKEGEIQKLEKSESEKRAFRIKMFFVVTVYLGLLFFFYTCVSSFFD